MIAFKDHKLISLVVYIITIIIGGTVGVNYTRVNIEYRTSMPGMIQLYYDNQITEGYYFDENHTQRETIEETKEFTTSNFKVPFRSLEKIRFDFDQMNQVDIRKITISIACIPIITYKANDIYDKFKIKNDITMKNNNECLSVYAMGNDCFIANDKIPLKKVYTGILCLSIIIGGIIALLVYRFLSILLVERNIELRLERESILIAIFIAILILPTNIDKLFLDHNSEGTENRVLNKKPQFNLHNIDEYPNQYEIYYNDHIPMKQDIVRLNNYLKYNILGISPANYVIKGKHDWLFYNSKNKLDGDTLSDYLGTNHYTEYELQKIKENLLEKQAYLKERNIEFYLMICPNKMQIYPEYMPNYFIRQQKTTKADELVAYLEKHTDLKIIYPKQQLLDSKEERLLYYKWDTHWNEQGAYIGFKLLLDKIGGNKAPELKQLEVSSEAISKGDLSNMISINPKGTDYDYTIGYRPEIGIDLVEQQGSILRYKSTNLNSKKLMMFRDSFTTALIPYITKEFNESLFIWDAVFDVTMIEKEQPQIVIYEVVERSLDVLMY